MPLLNTDRLPETLQTANKHFYRSFSICCLLALTMQAAHAKKTTEEIDFISTGGKGMNRTVCPTTPNDVVVPLKSLNPPPKPGEPEMTIEGLHRFIKKHKIKTITALLNTFPDHYRTNFSLVEHTRATGQSNLEFPRIVLFGSDGRLLLNIGTKADDPKYDLLDVAELHEDTGQWEFSVFDFSGKKPKLKRNDESCIECHGDKNSRPVWGTNLEWTGAFGDNIAPGPQGEALDDTHLLRIREIMRGKGDSDRFDFLMWSHKKLIRGGKRWIANHFFGPDLFLSNIAMGSATGRGAFIRLTQKHPKRYRALRAELLLLGLQKLKQVELDAAVLKHIETKIKSYGGSGHTLDDAFAVLGLDTSEAFSLATLFSKEPPEPNWQLGAGTLYEQVLLQILDDSAADIKGIKTILTETAAIDAVFNCPITAKNIDDAVTFKMLHLFHLRGEARYKVNWVYYPLAIEHISEIIFKPIAAPLHDYLVKQITPTS